MPSTVRYRERLIPSALSWLVVLAMTAVFGIAFGAALGTAVGWLTFAILSGLAGAILVLTSPTIEVTEGELRVGSARLPRHHVSSVDVLDADATRQARGPGADARQYLVLRSMTASTAVRIVLNDPDDPHPSWLVSSRRPDDFAAALQ